MINIILKNRTLIKIYKYSLKTFKFLNKHLYILSFLYLISKARKSVFYKFFSYLIKITIAINLIFTSGLMFNLADLNTPFQQVINLYYIVLGPYIELLKYKFYTINNLLFQIEEDIPFSTFQRVKTINNKTMLVDKVQDIIDLDDKELLEDPSKTKSSYVKYFVLGCAVGIVLYIIFLPSPGTDPNVLADYNSINQFLINSKSSITDSFISIYNQFIGD
jgi:hypothetical protein